jgi:outer membrane immunogenic protein
LAWGRADYTANTTGGGGFVNFPTSFGDTAHGYVVGGGLEYALDTNWSVRAEYLHYRLGGATQTILSVDTNPPGHDGSVNYRWNAFQANIVRVGVDYKFGQ